MGHVLSFPILCLANYLIFRFSFESRNRRVPRVLVNGDDILFHAFPNEYKDWCDDVRKVGFLPSVGKNLFQSDIAQINSVLFRTKWNFSEPFKPYLREVKAVPYLSMGLITGRGKGKSSRAETDQASGLQLNMRHS